MEGDGYRTSNQCMKYGVLSLRRSKLTSVAISRHEVSTISGLVAGLAFLSGHADIDGAAETEMNESKMRNNGDVLPYLQ